MLTLTIRAFAELIHLQAYEWLRILAEHKYPKQGAAIFKIPYYQPALRHIEQYYRQGNDRSVLPHHPSQLLGIGNSPVRRSNNYRVIQSFSKSKQLHRQFRPYKPVSYSAVLGPVRLKATADLAGYEGSEMKSLLYNCRILEPDNALIRTTVELFHRVLTQNGQAVPLASIEYVCPCSDRTYSWKGNVRKSTLKRAREVAKVIKSVWDSV